MSTQQSCLATLRSASAPVGQRGVVLFIALIVMVAMSLAAIALFRSVDTANLVAGNQAFKQGALSATDLGIAAAMDKFNASITGSPLSSEAATHASLNTNCYVSTTLQQDQLDARGIPKLLLDPTTTQSPFADAFDTTYVTNCKITNGTTGEIIRFIIDRQCDASVAGSAPSNGHCTVVSSSATSQTDNDKQTGSESIPLYRVTVRVDGPRHTVSYAQVLFRP